MKLSELIEATVKNNTNLFMSGPDGFPLSKIELESVSKSLTTAIRREAKKRNFNINLKKGK